MSNDSKNKIITFRVPDKDYEQFEKLATFLFNNKKITKPEPNLAGRFALYYFTNKTIKILNGGENVGV